MGGLSIQKYYSCVVLIFLVCHSLCEAVDDERQASKQRNCSFRMLLRHLSASCNQMEKSTFAAWVLDQGKEFSYGAGHISPVNATNPGLISEADYVDLLCSIGYPSATVARMFRIECSKSLNKDLNYPSMTYNVGENSTISASFSRTVTNVGLANSTYTAKISKPWGIDITVEPATLLKEKKSFVVTVKGGPLTSMVCVV